MAVAERVAGRGGGKGKPREPRVRVGCKRACWAAAHQRTTHTHEMHTCGSRLLAIAGNPRLMAGPLTCMRQPVAPPASGSERVRLTIP